MTLFPTFNPDTGLHEIWVRDDGMRAMPAGPRIFRANPPAATFEHESEESAKAEIARLNQYLATVRKEPSRRKAARAGA